MYEYANEANIMGNKHATGLFLVVGVHLKTFSSIGSLKQIEEKTILLLLIHLFSEYLWQYQTINPFQQLAKYSNTFYYNC